MPEETLLAFDFGEKKIGIAIGNTLTRFANQLHGRFGLAVELVDERGSSMEAQQLLGTHAADDAVAAAVILQRYLDTLPQP